MPGKRARASITQSKALLASGVPLSKIEALFRIWDGEEGEVHRGGRLGESFKLPLQSTKYGELLPRIELPTEDGTDVFVGVFCVKTLHHRVLL